MYQDPDLDVQTVVTGSAPVVADTTDRGGWPFQEGMPSRVLSFDRTHPEDCMKRCVDVP